MRKAVSQICLIYSNFMRQIGILPDFTADYASFEWTSCKNVILHYNYPLIQWNHKKERRTAQRRTKRVFRR